MLLDNYQLHQEAMHLPCTLVSSSKHTIKSILTTFSDVNIDIAEYCPCRARLASSLAGVAVRDDDCLGDPAPLFAGVTLFDFRGVTLADFTGVTFNGISTYDVRIG